MITYQRIMLTQKLPYPQYWMLVGCLFYGAEMLLLLLFGETSVSWFQVLIATVGIFGVIVGWIAISLAFQTGLKSLGLVLEFPGGDAEAWVQEKANDLFTFRRPAARIVVVCLVSLALATVIMVGLPFQSLVMNIILGVELALFSGVCAHGAYFLIGILAALARVATYPIKTTFYRADHPSIITAYRSYSSSTLIVLILYLWLVLIVWFSPFGIRSYVAIWPTVLAFYPLAMFVWSLVQIHTLMYRAKQVNIDVIHQQVSSAFITLRDQPSSDNAQLLSQLMDVQKRIEAIREWPVVFQGTFTFVATAIIPVVQVLLTVFKK